MTTDQRLFAANWGQFGDYFNWIIGFVNLILLVKLTQIANNLSSKGLTELSETIGKLINLERLNLSANKLPWLCDAMMMGLPLFS